MMEFARMLEMNRPIAIAAVDVELVWRSGGGFCKGGRKGKEEVRGAVAKAGAGEGARPGGMELVRDDQIDSALFQQAGGGADDRGCGRGWGEAIDDGAHAHIAELLVVPHLGIEDEGPAFRDTHAQKARVRGW